MKLEQTIGQAAGNITLEQVTGMGAGIGAGTEEERGVTDRAVINMTPHPVMIVNADGKVIRTYPACGRTIRLESRTVDAGRMSDGTPLTRTVFGRPVGLPEQECGTSYIVSQIVKSALPDRGDLYVPAEVVRDADGNIIGCQSLGV